MLASAQRARQVRALLALPGRRRAANPAHPGLCGRCDDNLYGAAKPRRACVNARGPLVRCWALLAGRRAGRPGHQATRRFAARGGGNPRRHRVLQPGAGVQPRRGVQLSRRRAGLAARVVQRRSRWSRSCLIIALLLRHAGRATVLRRPRADPRRGARAISGTASRSATWSISSIFTPLGWHWPAFNLADSRDHRGRGAADPRRLPAAQGRGAA